jgi:hypothetical protein
MNHCSLETLDLDCLSHDKGGHILRDITGEVGLDEEVKVARLVVAGDKGIGSDDIFLHAVWLKKSGSDRDVLADWEAEDEGWDERLKR